MRRIWRGEERGTDGPIGPAPVNVGGPPLILGAFGSSSIRRLAGMVDGWIMGGGTPDMFLDRATAFEKAWKEAGRTGIPRKLSLCYFALGKEARDEAVATIKRYYAWLGPFADQIVAGMATSPEMVKAYAEGFRESGYDDNFRAGFGSARPGQPAGRSDRLGARPPPSRHAGLGLWGRPGRSRTLPDPLRPGSHVGPGRPKLRTRRKGTTFARQSLSNPHLRPAQTSLS